ncbi:MAG: cyanophycinase [Chloroflexota bacterium]
MEAIRVYTRVVLVGIILSFTILPTSASAKKDYDYYVTGNPGDVERNTSGGLMLMGGGPNVDEAFQWLISNAESGDIVVIRASGSDEYNLYIDDLGEVDSVETIVFHERDAAYDQNVVDIIMGAEALFMAGGDQWNYLRYWKDTPVEDAIQALTQRGVPIGGTSAGLAVMGEFSFSAENDTVYSDEALADPYNRHMTFERDFLKLPYLGAVITDSHFRERDRMGRLTGFLARLVEDDWMSEAFGIGIDEETAVLIDQDGYASLRGNGGAYFLRTPGRPEQCEPDTPLIYRDVEVYHITSSGSFDLVTWEGDGGTFYRISVENGDLVSSKGSIY